MKTGAKLFLFHPSTLHKGGAAAAVAASHRVWLLAFLSFFTLASVLTLITTKDALSAAAANSSGGAFSSKPRLPASVFDALVQYATANSSDGVSRLSSAELGAVVAALRRCSADKSHPCNFLVFGMNHEMVLWNTLNYNGRTVFVSDDEYTVRVSDAKHPEIEAYDVQYPTKVWELDELLAYAKSEILSECRPVQNLLFSDCKLAINDFPNYIYDVAWDVILVDGPIGNTPVAPGRMTPIFTAGVFARSKRGGRDKTDIFVHTFDREVERRCSEEFLCGGNLVRVVDSLGHFSIDRREMSKEKFEFCPNLLKSSSKSNRRFDN